MAASVVGNFTLHLLDKCDVISKKPERFLSAQKKLATELKSFTKKLYDSTKEYERLRSKLEGPTRTVDTEALPELIVEDFDEEQIWQELELQNTAVNGAVFKLVSKVLKIGEKEPNLLNLCPFLDVSNGRSDSSSDSVKESDVSDENLEVMSDVDKGEEEGGGEEDDNDDADARSESSIELEKTLDKRIAHELGDGKDDDDEEGEEQEEEEEEERDTDVEAETLLDVADHLSEGPNAQRVGRTRPRSEVDDRFFRLSELESFLDLEDAKEERRTSNDDSDDGIDYFQEVESDVEDENDDDGGKGSAGQLKYSAFFDPPDDDEAVDLNRGSKRKSLFENDEGSTNKKERELSTYEKRQIKLKEKISRLEEINLSDKPWQMMGESSSALRPENSLLAEHLQFDHMTRQAPLITEETTVKLEDIIKQRIKDKVWDDVERKVKPTEEPFEYKKRIVLDQEKSKMSLAEIYEQEYLKKQQSENADDIEEEESKEHKEIKKNMAQLFEKLDALCNFHFIPKKPRPEVKIVNNLPAITVEEVAPVGVSDAALLAPEEVKEKQKHGAVGKSERTDTDRNRERREKKVKQRNRRKHREAKEKMVNALNPGLGNKYSKAAAMKKLSEDGNVTVIGKNGNRQKLLKSSKDFFTQLQDEVRTSINLKKGGKKSVKDKQRPSAAKFKL